MTLGYYYQNPIIFRNGQPEVPFDLYLACKEFTKYFEKVVIFANYEENSNRNTNILPPKVELVNLGPLKPHWMRLIGFGYNKKLFSQKSSSLDAILLQGPTSLIPHLAQNAPRPLKIFLQVGFWGSLYPGQFANHGKLKELGLQIMIRIAEYQQKKSFRKGIIFSNNPLKIKMYSHLTKGYLVSKGLVEKKDISQRPSMAINGTLKLLYYGRIGSDKHIETILRACQILKKENFNFQFDIVGDDSGAYLSFLKNMVEELNLNDTVTFHGVIPFNQKKVYFDKADIFIFHTCGTEGFPRVIWEAFSFGIPVIAANYPGADLFFENNKHLILFERKNQVQLAEIIKKLSSNENLRDTIGKGGQELLLEHTLEKGHAHMADLIKKNLQKQK